MSHSLTGPAPTSSRPRAPFPGFALRFGIGLCLALLFGYAWLATSTVQRSGGPDTYVRKTDFLSVLTAATILAEGHPTQIYDETAQHTAQAAILRKDNLTLLQLLPFNHPPIEPLLILPLVAGGVSPVVIFGLWDILNLIALGASVVALRWAWPVTGRSSPLLLLGTLAFFPITVALLLGQSTLLVLLGWAAGSALLRRNHTGWAGAAFAVTMLKPQAMPVILLALLLRRCWPALVSWATTVTLATVALMPALGLDWPLRYLGFVYRVSTGPPNAAIDPRTMQNWRGLFERLIGTGLSATALTVAASLLSLTLVTAAWWATRRIEPGRGQPSGESWDHWWAGALLVAVLVSPHVEPHDLTLALAPGWILATRAVRQGGWRLPTWLWVGWASGFLAGVSATWSLSPAVCWMAITAAGLLGRLLRSSAPTSEPSLAQARVSDQST
jgi:hypothetical protein